MAEPLVKALCKAHPGACEQRVLEGSPHPCGQLPLELAVTKGWDARVVDVVQKTYPKAAETLDPVKVPGGILKKAFPPPGKGLPDQEFLNELGGPEVLSNDIKGATVAVLALSGWNKDKQPTTPKGMRWVRKAAEECRPLPKLEVVMLLPKPDPKNLENGWSDGREVQRLLEEKLHKKACKDAKNASKRAKKAEGFAKKVRSRRPVVWRRLHFTDTTRVHLTMTWVVSFSILSRFGPSREPRCFTQVLSKERSPCATATTRLEDVETRSSGEPSRRTPTPCRLVPRTRRHELRRTHPKGRCMANRARPVSLKKASWTRAGSTGTTPRWPWRWTESSSIRRWPRKARKSWRC